MVQVLHLTSVNPDLQVSRAVEALEQRAGNVVRMQRRTIGRGGDYRSIFAAALSILGPKSVRFDLVHAWDRPALLAAMTSSKPIVFSPSALITDEGGLWLGAMQWRGIQTVCATHAEHALNLRRRIRAEHCPAIQPGVDASQVQPGRRQELRKRLGFSPDDRVLLAPGESTIAAGHRLAVHAASILHVLDRRHRILLWGRGREFRSIAALGPKLYQPRVIVGAEQMLGHAVKFEELLAAVDLAVITPAGIAPTLSWAMCMAAGVPIAAIETAQTREVFTGVPDVIVAAAGPRELARRSLELLENPAQSRQLGQATAAAAGAQFRIERLVDQYLDLYQNIAANPAPADNAAQRASALSRIRVTGPSLSR